MDSCPNEILGDIVQLLPKPDLFNLRLVGRRLKNVATRPVFTQLTLYDDVRSAQKFSSLMVECDDELILYAVETITFDGTAPDHFDMGSEPTTLWFENSFSLLYRLPNLRSLSFNFFAETSPTVTYYSEIQLAIWRGLSCTPIPQLKSLEIGSMATYFPCLIDDMDLSMQALFRSLTTLSILAVSLVKNHRVPGHLLTFNPNMTCILTAAQNITSLELGTTVLTGPTSPFCFETLTFPSLTSLLLYTIVFAGLPDNQEPPPSAFLDGQRLTVETFVLNHKATLQNLVLDNCAVPAPNGAWHRVFKRLRIQLSQLVEFSWITRHSRSDKKFIYAQPGGELNTYKVPEDDEPDNQNDTAALEDLQTAVILRRNNRSS